jgi:hypothetical protein
MLSHNIFTTKLGMIVVAARGREPIGLLPAAAIKVGAAGLIGSPLSS